MAEQWVFTWYVDHKDGVAYRKAKDYEAKDSDTRGPTKGSVVDGISDGTWLQVQHVRDNGNIIFDAADRGPRFLPLKNAAGAVLLKRDRPKACSGCVGSKSLFGKTSL